MPLPGGGYVLLRGLDDYGRPTGIVATITPSTTKGTRVPWRLKPPGFGGRRLGQARGHLLARILGGPGKDRRNVVTLFHRGTNDSAMVRIENEIRKALAKGETIQYQVKPVYRGDLPFPTEIGFEAHGSRGFDLALALGFVNERRLSIPNISDWFL